MWHSERPPAGRVMAALKRALPLIGITYSSIGLTFDSEISFPGWIALVPTAGAASLIFTQRAIYLQPCWGAAYRYF